MPRPYHLDQIARFCSQHPTEKKILLVPNRQVGYNLLTGLARSGFSWVNLDPMSVSDFAEMEAGPVLRSRGLRRMSSDIIGITLAQILERIKDGDSEGYFKPIAVTPSLVRSVWSTLSSIRMAGIVSDMIDKRVSDTRKGRALAELVRAFDTAVSAGNWYDNARLLDEATSIENAAAVRGAITEETLLTAMERRYLEQVFGTDLVVIGRDGYGVPAPEPSARTYFGSATSVTGTVHVAGEIATDGLSAEDRESVAVWGARGPENEVRDVLRAALSRGIALDEIEIAYTRSSTYLPLLVDLADGLDLDVAFAEGVPANLTRPGRGLTGFLQWILDETPVSALAGLLQADLMQFERFKEEPGARMSTLASLLLEAPIGERIDRYEPGLDALLHEAESKLDSVEQGSSREAAAEIRVRELKRLKRSIADLKSRIPSETNSTMDRLVDLALHFLDRNAVVHGDRDKIAQESLIERLEHLRGTPERVPVRFGLQMIIDMVQQHTIQVSTARRGAIFVTDIARAGYSGRQNLFVVGLDVDSFPGRTNEDPILLDLERERISNNLGKRALEAGDRTWHLLRALGMTPGHVFLGTPVFDAEREDTSVYPSPFMQSAARQLGYRYDDLPPLGVADYSLDWTDLLLPQRNRADFRPVLSSIFPWLGDGQTAVDQRNELRFGQYDGWLGFGDPAFRTDRDNPVFSNTRLERLADCGYRYFLSEVLRVRKPEYYEMDPARWLSAKDFGILLHDLYHDFLAALSERKEMLDLERHRPLIMKQLSDAIERYRERFPEENLAAYHHEVQRLRQSAETFLRTESLSNAVPREFELVFGYPDADDPNLRKPAVIDLGDGLAFSLSGRIDRIDETEEGLLIWDYKTGSSWKFTQGSLLRGGLNLQWALYAVALEQIRVHLGLDGPVVRSGYYFASDRENGLQLSEPPLSTAELAGVVGPLLEMVNLGAFLKVNKDEGACKFCDYNALCSKESVKRRDMTDRWAANEGAGFHAALERWMEIPE